MTGQALDAFACPRCRARLAPASREAVACAGTPPHTFRLRDGAPVLRKDEGDQAAALEGVAAAYEKWAAATGDRWERQRKRVFRAVVDAAVQEAPPPGVFADIGAGGGALAGLAAGANFQALALDAALPPAGPYLRAACDFHALPLPDESVRVAAFVASLHYAADLGGTLREASRALRPDGVLLIGLTPLHRSAEGAEGAAETTRHEIRAAAGDNPLSVSYRHLTRSELDAALDAAGLKAEELPSGMGAVFLALRKLREMTARKEFARFPLLLCRKAGPGGAWK